MVALALTAVVGSLGLTGFGLFAATLAAGAIGSFIDSRLFATHQTFENEGPRLQEIHLSTANEGVPITRLFGRARLGGNMIWTTDFREVKTTETNTQRTGKGGGSKVTTTTTTYTYFVSCAFAFTEGNERATIGRIWADNKLLDTSGIVFRFYPGSQTQPKDPKIVQTEGTENVSAYRGVAYIVFEDLELTQFGNRIPQITAEIIVPLNDPEAEIIENLLEAVNLIPASGEVAYATTPTTKNDGYGNQIPENIHLTADETDLQFSIRDLKSNVPNIKDINLVVSWFGTDLRLSHCDIEPRVEVNEGKVLNPTDWRVSNYVRNVSGISDFWDILFPGLPLPDTGGITNVQIANEVSKITVGTEQRPAFGGTPADFSIVESIKFMCDDEGLNVIFYPFIMMDIPAGNGLPDPYGGAEQAIYPWRGRITVSDPSVDGTSAAQTEMDSFFGSASASDFTVNGTVVNYVGNPNDRGLRRMVLHYAHLFAAAANSLDDPTRCKAFYVGTEMVGTTRVRRDGTGNYPGVDAFNTLINDVKAIFNAAGVGHIQISYAADWSEYHSHRPSDGSNDVFFNMDPIWSNPNCDYIAIDNYFPISDWRDGVGHLDYGTGVDQYGRPRATNIYDLDYLRGQIEGGEYYDYYYASESDRENQIRTDIFDSLNGKHWVFRQKDIRNWWNNEHFNRPGGSESVSPTSWSPASKKVVFSEFGCPAINKGTNQPNVFFDPKSSESFFPYFSNGNRDDVIQRAYHEAMITYWRDNAPTVGGVKLIDPQDMASWTWDARPFPAFPYQLQIWSDGSNWNLGHWLTGRVGVTPLGELVKAICAWVGFTDNEIDVTGLMGTNAVVRGYPIDNIMSPREALNPLFTAYMFDGFESQGMIKFILRANTPFFPVNLDDFITTSENPSGYQINRAQETELPANSVVSYYDEEKEYNIGTVGDQRQTTQSQVVAEIRIPIVVTNDFARALSAIIIQEAWAAREQIEFVLPPSKIALDPGDGVVTTIGGRQMQFRLSEIKKGEALEMTAGSIDVSLYDGIVPGASLNSDAVVEVVGASVVFFLDIPVADPNEPRHWAPRVAAYQTPFPPAVNIYEDTGTDLLLTNQLLSRTQMGILAADLPIGPHTIIDEGNVVQVDVLDPNFQVLGATENEVRNGANAIAIRTSNGDWEIMKFVNSSLQGGRRYNLTRLFRGQLGTYPIMEDPIPAGSPIVFLDAGAMEALGIPNSRKFDTIDWRYGPNVYPVGSALYQTVQHTGQAVGLLPYPVADIQFFPSGSDVTITWKRQSRFNAEGFEEATVPLNEDEERYQLDLLDGSDVLQFTAEVTSPSYTYVGAPSVFKVRIFQMSAQVGRGRPAERTYGA